MRLLKLLLFVVLITANGIAFAQLTNRIKNDSSSINFGTRPKKGDKSLMMSINLRDSSMKIVRTRDLLKLSDKLIFKYYIKDDLVFRASARVITNRQSAAGTIADSSYYNNIVKPHISETKGVYSYGETILIPGIEKHFSSFNVFDIYYGLDLPIGLTNTRAQSDIKYTNGDYSSYKAQNISTVIGFNPFVGLNVFVGKLPLSLGLEYGWNSLWKANNKNSISQQDQITVGSQANAYTAEYQKQNASAFLADNNKYGKLNVSELSGGLNQVIKFTANIYFK